MTTTTAIDVTGMVKTFGNVRALDGLNLSVDTGEVHGFLGPNGAGKSTAIKVLLGQLRADAGSAVTPGGMPSSCIAGSPTSPAMSICGRTCPVVR